MKYDKIQLALNPEVAETYLKKICESLEEMSGQEFHSFHQVFIWVKEIQRSELVIIEKGKIVNKVDNW